MDRKYTDILNTLAAEDNLRTLRETVPDGRYLVYGGRRYLNLSSNDYLGIGTDTELQQEFLAGLGTPGRFLMGTPSSRLMTGNGPEYTALEKSVSALFGGDRECLVFGSGYLANSAVLPVLTVPGDVILADRLVHASIVDGIRLAGCRWERFRHNDTVHLEKLIIKHLGRGCGTVWVATESVFSMDGDHAPLRELCALRERYGVRLYLDEAHAFGVYGPTGAGLASQEGLDGSFDIIVATLGKVVASQGGFTVCGAQVKKMLVNRARGVIFSTALPPISLMWSKFIVDRLPGMDGRRRHLAELAALLAPAGGRPSHIIPIMAYGNGEAARLADRLRDEGYWVTPIRYPTVPKGEARVRLSLNAAMEIGEIEKLAGICRLTG